MKKSFYEYIPAIALFISILMVINGMFMLKEHFKNVKLVNEIKVQYRSIKLENDRLKNTIEEYKYKESRSRHCSLETIECND